MRGPGEKTSFPAVPAASVAPSNALLRARASRAHQGPDSPPCRAWHFPVKAASEGPAPTLPRYVLPVVRVRVRRAPSLPLLGAAWPFQVQIIMVITASLSACNVVPAPCAEVLVHLICTPRQHLPSYPHFTGEDTEAASEAGRGQVMCPRHMPGSGGSSSDASAPPSPL